MVINSPRYKNPSTLDFNFTPLREKNFETVFATSMLQSAKVQKNKDSYLTLIKMGSPKFF
jgi:hypothetical protein